MVRKATEGGEERRVVDADGKEGNLAEVSKGR